MIMHFNHGTFHLKSELHALMAIYKKGPRLFCIWHHFLDVCSHAWRSMKPITHMTKAVWPVSTQCTAEISRAPCLANTLPCGAPFTPVNRNLYSSMWARHLDVLYILGENAAGPVDGETSILLTLLSELRQQLQCLLPLAFSMWFFTAIPRLFPVLFCPPSL